jgi:hypothetical protein
MGLGEIFMTLKKSFLAFALMLSALVCRPALAWNAVGHMTVAYVAYQKLSPAEKTRVAVLLKLNPYYDRWISYLPAGLQMQIGTCMYS